MDINTQEKAKKALEQIQEMLKDKTLTDEERQELEIHEDKLAGALLSTWLPVGVLRKLLMMTFVLVAVYGFVSGMNWLIASSVIAGMFSPRLVGEVTYLLGRLSR